MSLRDIIVITAIIGSLPFCFRKPWIGILVWSWIGYMNPHRLTWGVAYSMPFAQMVAIATIFGMFFTREKQPMPMNREVFLLFVMFFFFTITTIFSINPEEAWNQYDKVWKIFLMTFLTLMVMQDKKKLMALIWVITLSIGFYGVKGGFFAIVTGGQHRVLGPENTFIAGNTVIGLAINMIIPLLVFLRREDKRYRVRHLLSAFIGLSVIASLVTYSRGAFVGMIVIVSFLVLRSRAKMLAVSLIIIAVPLTMNLLPEKWFGQMETIETYEEDTSAMMRICSWHVAYAIAKEKPLLGAGFRPFSPEYYERYQPLDCPPQWSSDAHSIYFQVLAEHGFTGLVLYIGLMLTTLLSLKKILKMTRKEQSLQWMFNCAQMIEVCIWVFAVSGAFLSMSYFDLYYHFVAITVILKKLLQEHIIEQNKFDLQAVIHE